MQYALVATPQYLLCVDLLSKLVIPIEQTRPEYYGISWFPQHNDLVLSHSALDNGSLVDIASYAQSEVGYVSAGHKTSRPFLSQPHQLLCAPDGRIICTNTGRNVVTVIDLDKPGTYQEAAVSDARWDRLSLDEKIGDHINSIFLKDDKLFVVCHRFDKGSYLATFAYPSLELIHLKKLSGVSGLHNILVTNEGQYISCNSEKGSLIDLANGETLWESGALIFTRGLAASNEYLLIGESQQVGRNVRRGSLTGLWILEKYSWKVMDYIALGAFGCVHEVRLLDVPDEAHHGHPYAGLSTLLEKYMHQSSPINHSASNSGLKVYEAWEAYQPIFGLSEPLMDGSKKATETNLCLAILRASSSATNSFSFEYSLDAITPAHVSAVLGYAGENNDASMNALLLQRVENGAYLSLWQHHGTEWQMNPQVSVSNLPITGIMKIVIHENEVSLFIEDNKVLCLNATDFNLKNYRNGCGIRWIGATVKPVN